MFKVILITASMALIAFGRPQQAPPAAAAAGSSAPATGNSSAATFLKDERQPLDDKGSYKYDIELSDGTKLQQEGNTEAPGAGENETSIVIKGSYSYTAPDGTPVNVMYIANKDGYQPTGDVIPKSSSKAAASPPAAGSSSAAAPPAAAPPAAAASAAAATQPAPPAQG
ncbi:cuticle protein CP14.6 [Folsomia candida]|uniref:cuticle protein CP14.6 n=1 Tax=Folsomia candida TaxID=158441 RepID=UPI000B9076E5|nr:cuticle protein CP14.6 [Folsomia candida]